MLGLHEIAKLLFIPQLGTILTAIAGISEQFFQRLRGNNDNVYNNHI